MTGRCTSRAQSLVPGSVRPMSDGKGLEAALSALEAGLAEIERDETVTLAELRSELAERRPTAG